MTFRKALLVLIIIFIIAIIVIIANFNNLLLYYYTTKQSKEIVTKIAPKFTIYITVLSLTRSDEKDIEAQAEHLLFHLYTYLYQHLKPLARVLIVRIPAPPPRHPHKRAASPSKNPVLDSDVSLDDWIHSHLKSFNLGGKEKGNDLQVQHGFGDAKTKDVEVSSKILTFKDILQQSVLDGSFEVNVAYKHPQVIN